MPRITLIGYRGCGKSTVAALLAGRLACDWLDADAEFESQVGTSLAEFVADRGEAAFRDAEAAILERLVRGFPGVLWRSQAARAIRADSRFICLTSGASR